MEGTRHQATPGRSQCTPGSANGPQRGQGRFARRACGRDPSRFPRPGIWSAVASLAGGSVPRIAAVAALAWILSGCAYSFTGTSIPSYIKTIAVPTFDNQTLQPGLDQEVTTGVIDRFIKDGRLKIAPDKTANCRLVGRVLKYENKVNNYNADQTPQDYIVVLTVGIVLRDQVKNRDLWKDDAMVKTAVYTPGGQPGTQGGVAGEDQARAQAISDLSGDLVSRTLEQW